MSKDGIKAKLKVKCFQILGLDILVDQDMKTWLLEVNDNPSLYIYHEKDYMAGGADKTLSKADLSVKKKVLRDAIALVKRQNIPEESYRSYERIAVYGNDGIEGFESSEQLDILHRLFLSLTQIKDQSKVTSQGI